MSQWKSWIGPYPPPYPPLGPFEFCVWHCWGSTHTLNQNCHSDITSTFYFLLVYDISRLKFCLQSTFLCDERVSRTKEHLPCAQGVAPYINFWVLGPFFGPPIDSLHIMLDFICCGYTTRVSKAYAEKKQWWIQYHNKHILHHWILLKFSQLFTSSFKPKT